MLKFRPDKSDSYFELVFGLGRKLEETMIDVGLDLHLDKLNYEMPCAVCNYKNTNKNVFESQPFSNRMY